MIAKGAYNDRNSEFGWNVDHILPQSKGGVTAEHNLVCCHILTNDEKANRFPCFTANKISFEIIKVQNHYEIRSKSQNKKTEQKQDELNLYDSAAGIRIFKSMKGMQNKKRFVGTIFVYLQSVSNGAVMDFIEQVFDAENIVYGNYSSGYGLSYANCTNIKITITNYDMPQKSDTSELLDKCVLINTYLSAYFLECEYVGGYDIYYREDCFDSKFDFFKRQTIKEPNVSGYWTRNNSLYINELVLCNTDAKNKIQRMKGFPGEYTEYNFIFKDLQENLKKEANRK